MTVTDGASPANHDKNVRFRTTYFFRVYDYCYDLKTQSKLQPTTDSLYRFVMTGKANAFANRIRFESGTLKADQIDPFGATIERDDKTGRMRFVPRSEVEARARRGEAQDEIEALIELRDRLANTNAKADGDSNANSDIVTALNVKIKEIVNTGLSSERISSGAVEASDSAASPNASSNASKVCPAGTEIQRGFQIMGPQGVKTYDQNERLIMAMSTYAKPLINSLEEVSGRFLQAEENKADASDLLLALVTEQLRVKAVDLIIATKKDDEAGSAFVGRIHDRLIDGDDPASLKKHEEFTTDVETELKPIKDSVNQKTADDTQPENNNIGGADNPPPDGAPPTGAEPVNNQNPGNGQ